MNGFDFPRVPVLSLDLDGVLHPVGTVSWGEHGVLSLGDAFCWLEHLQRALEGFDSVPLLVHSTWRLHFETDEALRAHLPAWLAQRMHSATPRTHMARERSVDAALHALGARASVIVDDEPRAFASGRAGLVACSGHSGLAAPGKVQELRAALQAAFEQLAADV